MFRLDCLCQCEAVAVTGQEYRRNKKIKEEARGKYFKQLATSSQQGIHLKKKQECVFIKQGLIVSQLLPTIYRALFKDACLIILFLASLFFFLAVILSTGKAFMGFMKAGVNSVSPERQQQLQTVT